MRRQAFGAVRGRARLGAVALVAGVVVVAGAGPALAAPRPDLVVTSVSKPPATVGAGLGFKVVDVTKNVGRRRARASATGYYLSSDARRGPGDKRLARRSVPRLGPGKTSKGSKVVTVPASTPLGKYYVLACADDTRNVGESREGNNCRASTTKVQVRAPTCVEQLTLLGMSFTKGPASPGIEDPVTVHPPIAGVAYVNGAGLTNANILMDCALARQVWTATDGLADLGIDSVEHFGVYNYRCIGGGTPPDCPGGISQHAYAMAIDFASFTDGATVYDVETDWVIDPDPEDTCTAPTADAEDAFLHAVVCSWAEQNVFNILLTPNYNADHYNHFHVDLTPGADFIE